jgi:CheY-like chemotaxis protein
MVATNILVVDDTPIECLALYKELESEGYSVDTATSGDEALQKVRVKDYDIVFVDLVMPGMDGVETCKSIKKEKSGPVAILMTGHVETGLREKEVEFVKAGGEYYCLYKPFLPGELAQAAKRALQQKFKKR